MSKYDEDDEIEIEQCDCCKSSMTANEFAYMSDEDSVGEEYDMEFVMWLDSKKYHKLCHRCLKKMKQEAGNEEDAEKDAYMDMLNELEEERNKTREAT